jgi:hypothetical protein
METLQEKQKEKDPGTRVGDSIRVIHLGKLHASERIVAYDLYEDGLSTVIRERVAA